MTENICRYSGDRDQAIVSYLYGDDGGLDVADRATFDAHLAACDRCRAELAAFEGVRTTLGAWSPPEFSSSGLPRRSSGNAPSGGGWREIPAWAQAAAALLCLGVGAGIANLNVRYDANGLQVRTGWSAVAPAPAAEGRQPAAGSAGDPGVNAAPWRAELTALEQRLRADLRQPSPAVASLANALDDETLRRIRTLVDESERRQQRELALRLAEAMREINVQRQTDLVRIDRSIGVMQNSTGREMLRQRNDMLNYVALRTAAQRPQ